MSTPIYYRQPKESAKAFAAFQLYRDMGVERSLAKVGQQLGKSTPLMERWSKRWNWVARVTAWDMEQDRRAREANLKQIEQMRERHAQMAVGFQSKALERLATIRPEDLKPKDALDFFALAARIEASSRGAPCDIVEQRIRDAEQETPALWDALQEDGFRDLLARMSKRASASSAATGEVDSGQTNGRLAISANGEQKNGHPPPPQDPNGTG